MKFFKIESNERNIYKLFIKLEEYTRHSLKVRTIMNCVHNLTDNQSATDFVICLLPFFSINSKETPAKKSNRTSTNECNLILQTHQIFCRWD